MFMLWPIARLSGRFNGAGRGGCVATILPFQRNFADRTERLRDVNLLNPSRETENSSGVRVALQEL